MGVIIFDKVLSQLGAVIIRTQIQLSESQMQALKEIARQRKVSVAALIREGADMVIRGGALSYEERKRRALAVKAFHGPPDLSENHDKYLAEDFV